MRKLAVHELNRLNDEEFRAVKKRPIMVILDNIRSANNVGSVFRTSDAFLVQKIYLCGYTARPPHKDIHKTALGADEIVEWEHVPDVSDAVKMAKLAGYEICAIEQTAGAISLEAMPWERGKPYAFVFGNEVNGVSDSVLPLADRCIEVPQWGTKHSLNISVCAGIVLWDCVRMAYAL